MVRRILALLLLIAAVVSAAETAQTVMSAATTAAASTNRNVLVLFHATWCGWCKKFDAMLADPKVGPLLDRSFTVAQIDVLERDDKVSLNTPGGEEVMAKLGGKNQGLPFFAVADTHGSLIVNSLRQPDDKNIGYPAQPEEIDWFILMLKKSAPRLNPAETALIQKWLQDAQSAATSNRR